MEYVDRRAYEQLRADNEWLRADNERLRAALTDIASDLCSLSGAVGIAKDALAGKSRDEWS